MQALLHSSDDAKAVAKDDTEAVDTDGTGEVPEIVVKNVAEDAAEVFAEDSVEDVVAHDAAKGVAALLCSNSIPVLSCNERCNVTTRRSVAMKICDTENRVKGDKRTTSKRALPVETRGATAKNKSPMPLREVPTPFKERLRRQ